MCTNNAVNDPAKIQTLHKKTFTTTKGNNSLKKYLY